MVFARYARHEVAFTQEPSCLRMARELDVALTKLLGNSNQPFFFGRLGRGQPPVARSLRLPVEKLVEISGPLHADESG